MATIPTPEQGKPILDFSAGTFDGNSNLFQSRNGATEHINGDDVADYVNTSRIYNTLDTESKTPVGAINEVNRKAASDIAYDNTSSGLTASDVNAAIDEMVNNGSYRVGDRINLSNLPFSCYANTSNLYICVPVRKIIPSGSTLTIAGNWRILLTNSDTFATSVILNNAALSTIGTVSAISYSVGCVRINVALNSGVISSWSLGNAYGMSSNAITIS